ISWPSFEKIGASMVLFLLLLLGCLFSWNAWRQTIRLSLVLFSLIGFADYNKTLISPRNRTLNHQEVLLNINLEDLKIFNRTAHTAHMARHPHSFENTRGVRTRSDGPWRSMKHRTMGISATSKMVAFHDTLESFAFGHAAHMHVITWLENICLDNLPHCAFLASFQTDFPEKTERGQFCLLEMALQGLLYFFHGHF